MPPGGRSGAGGGSAPGGGVFRAGGVFLGGRGAFSWWGRAFRPYPGGMGIIQKMREKAAAGPVATYGPFVLYGSGEVGRQRENGIGYDRVPLEGVSARVESGSELEKRVTATRLVAMGLLAFAVKKKRGGESWLTVEGPDVFWSVEVDREYASKARAFAAKVNEAAAHV